jgi:class 3 adenylate cyclase
MTTGSYKLIATIPSLQIARAFSLAPGRRYLLGSAEMGPGMLVFTSDRSLSRRQAFLEIIEDKLRVERHPKASQTLNGDDAINTLELRDGESFTAGMSVFRFVSDEAEDSLPDRTYVFASPPTALGLATAQFRSFIEVVATMPALMKDNETPAAFLLALCETLRTNISGMNVSAWMIELQEDLLQFSPLRLSESVLPGTFIKPSRHLLRQALSLAGDECAVSVWQGGTATAGVGQSVIASGAKWAMCIAISLSEQERFALYATGAHLLPGEQLSEVQRLFAALGAIAKQHLLAARAKERQGQIGQFFSPGLRTILFGDIAKADQTLQPAEHEAVICFFDLRGSSRVAEGMDIYTGRNAAINHFAFLERILGNAVSVIFDSGGIVIDFQGDGILACWGVPPQGAPVNPARQALVAARQIVELMAEFDWPAVVTESGAALRCGLGITCGKVLAGLFTAQGRNRTLLSKYSVIGRAVNQAARLEAMTKKLGVPILVDGALAQAVADEKLSLRRIGRLQPPGMTDVVEVHELVLPPELGGTGIDEKGLLAYQTALALFEQADFAAAARCELPDDAITNFLQKQIARHRDEPRSEAWNGVMALA